MIQMAEIKGGQPQQGQPNAKAQGPAPAEETRLYTVRGPGSVTVGGKIFPAGTELQLTAVEAESLGSNITPGRAKPIDVVEKRRAGKYVVAEGRSLWSDGKMRGPGFEIECSEAEARKLGDAIEPVA